MEASRRARRANRRHVDGGEPPKEGRGRRGLAIGALAAIALGAAVLAAASLAPRPAADPNAAAYASIGGPFTMTDQDGRPADQRLLKGRWSAVFFGYVSCPDVCPATLQALAAAEAKLGPGAGRFQVVFVSVDPRRDTPRLLRSYLGETGFPVHAVGLTGTPAQVAAIARAYRVYYSYAPRPAAQGGGYDVSHSGAVYLMDPRGRMAGVLSEAQGPDAMADQIRAAMRRGA